MEREAQGCGTAATAAYLGDPSATGGPARLHGQMSVIEGYAVAALRAPHVRLYVDSGSPDDPRAMPPALRRLVEDVRSGAVRRVVVAARGDLAADGASIRRVWRAMLAAGAELHEASTGKMATAGAARSLDR